MTDKEVDQELAFVAASAAEIRAGLDSRYTSEQLQRPMSTRMVHALVAGVTAATSAKLKALAARLEEVNLTASAIPVVIRERWNTEREAW